MMRLGVDESVTAALKPGAHEFLLALVLASSQLGLRPCAQIVRPPAAARIHNISTPCFMSHQMVMPTSSNSKLGHLRHVSSQAGMGSGEQEAHLACLACCSLRWCACRSPHACAFFAFSLASFFSDLRTSHSGSAALDMPT